MKHIIRLFVLIAALVLGADHALANAESNPRVKFVYDGDQHGTATASAADANRLVTITVTPEGDYRCKAGDLTAEQSVNSSLGEARRRAPSAVPSKGVTVPVTCEETNVFTLTLPEDGAINVTVYVKFSEKLTFTPTVSIVGWTYGDDPNVPSLESNTSGGGETYTYADTENGSYNSTVPTQAGLFWVKATVAATADYKECVSAPVEFTISQKQITIASVGVEDKEYDGTTSATLSGTSSFNDGMIVGDDVVSIDLSGASALFVDKNAGTNKNVTVIDLALAGQDKDNYTLANNIITTTGNITQKDLTITAKNKTINYGDEPANDGVEYGEFVEGEGVSNLSGTLGFDYGYSQYGSVGTYQITPNGLSSNNYHIIFQPGTLNVNPKTITITAEDISKTYDGTTAVQPHFTFQGGAILGSDDVSIDASGASAEFENKDVGTGKVVNVTGLALAGADMNNYDLRNPDFTTAGSITKKDLTITANDHTIDYGEEPDNGGVTYDGFVNGENENTSNIFGGSTLTYAYNTQADGLGTSYTTSSPVGNYYIIPSGLTSNNYNITYVSGTLTVNQKATISVNWDDNNDVGGLQPGSLEFKLLANGSDADPECKVTLSSENGWSVTVNGLTAYNGETLIPYTWSLETPPDIVYKDYELGDAPQSTSNTGATATFTYTRKTGSLTVTNTVVSDLAADADREFTYTVKLTPANITGTYGDMEFIDGEATVTLKAGESATATYLLYGTTYTVTQHPEEGFTTSPKVEDLLIATGTISTSSTQATFTNTRETGSLKVTNTVYPSSDNTAFTFMVKLSDTTISGEYGDMTFADGETTFPLSNGQTTTATATGLPTTVEYTVTQMVNNDFSTTKTGDTGSISATQSVAAFKNIMLTSATVKIVWDDANNQDGIRPTEMTATLSDGSEYNKTVTLNSTNSWTATVENLPMYNDDGDEITYTWTLGEPDGYVMTTDTTEDGVTTTVTLTLVPVYEITEAYGITDDTNEALKGKTVNIAFSRTFEALSSGEGKASTVCLPFDLDKPSKTAVGTFYTFGGVSDATGEYVVTMNEATTTTLSAGTPYMFVPATTDPITFQNTAYTVPGTGFTPAGTTKDDNDWEFIGTYEEKTWPKEQTETRLYGFAASNFEKSDGTLLNEVGAFRRFNYGHITPFRCYLMAPESLGARGMSKSGNQLPESMKVVLISADGTATAIGTLDTRTGEVTFGDDWYDLNGRRLDSKPTQKGVYIHNGNKTVIK